jgi:hypothetical protein
MPIPGMPPMQQGIGMSAGVPVAQRTSGMAIAGLVCAFFCSLLGLIFSIVGLNEIKKSNGAVGGKGIALAGLILSILHIVAMIFVVIFFVFAAKKGIEEIDHKLQSAEAELMLQSMSASAKSDVVTTGQFPIVDEPMTPAKSCCSFPGHHCPQSDADWATPGWQKLDFTVFGGHTYRYSVHSDGKTLDAEATAEPECDGVTTSVKLHMTIDSTGNATSTITTGR